MKRRKQEVNDGQVTLEDALDLKLVHQRDLDYYHGLCDGEFELLPEQHLNTMTSVCDQCTLVVVSTLSVVAVSRNRNGR